MSPETAIRALARAVDAKDAGTQAHSERVAQVALRLARFAGWPYADQHRMYRAGLVHDVGKLGIDAGVLQAARALTPAEYHAIRLHPGAGAELLRNDREAAWDAEQIDWVLHHHERPDGRGYPDALGFGAITHGAAILAMADSFDVMVSDRPYKRGKAHDAAVAEAVTLCGLQFCHIAVVALEQAHAAGRLAEAYALDA